MKQADMPVVHSFVEHRSVRDHFVNRLIEVDIAQMPHIYLISDNSVKLITFVDNISGHCEANSAFGNPVGCR